VEPVLYQDADILIRNKEVAALDDNGCRMFNDMRPCTIQVHPIVVDADQSFGR
jgi:hypothetical protein